MAGRPTSRSTRKPAHHGPSALHDPPPNSELQRRADLFGVEISAASEFDCMLVGDVTRAWLAQNGAPAPSKLLSDIIGATIGPLLAEQWAPKAGRGRPRNSALLTDIVGDEMLRQVAAFPGRKRVEHARCVAAALSISVSAAERAERSARRELSAAYQMSRDVSRSKHERDTANLRLVSFARLRGVINAYLSENPTKNIRVKSLLLRGAPEQIRPSRQL